MCSWKAIPPRRICGLLVMISIIPVFGCALLPTKPKQELQLSIIDNQQDKLTGLLHLRFRLLDAEGVPVRDTFNFTYEENGTPVSAYEGRAILRSFYTPYAMTVMLLDTSGSVMETGNLEKMKEAARQFVEVKHPTTQIAIFTFDCVSDIQVNTLITFTSVTTDLLHAINNLGVQQMRDYSSNVYGAVKDGIEILGQHATPNYTYGMQLVLFSDGKHRAGTGGRDYPTLEEVQQLMSKVHYSFFAVGFGPELDTTTLKTLGRDGYYILKDPGNVLSMALTWIKTHFGNKRDDPRTMFQTWVRYNQHYELFYCSTARAGDNNQLVIRAESAHTKAQHTVMFQGTPNFTYCREALAAQETLWAQEQR